MAAKKITKFDTAFGSCIRLVSKQKLKCNEKTLTNIAKSLGPSFFNKDARLVSTSSKAELLTIKKNFIEKKLKVKGEKADKALDYAITKIGRSNRHKNRAVFYYLIADKLGKLSVYK